MKMIPILLIILWSCNSESARPIRIEEDGISFDSLMALSDSTNEELRETKASLKTTISQISALGKKKSEVEEQIKSAPVYRDALAYYPEESSELADLKNKLREYEQEISRLKYRLYRDSLALAKYMKKEVPQEVESGVPSPDEKSLIITLDRKMRGDGEISEQGVTVYLIKYTKKVKKLMHYEVGCKLNDLNSFESTEATYYKGQYFFNGVAPGKYLVKVCAYYGNYMVINKEDRQQTVAMQMSPPIQ